MANSSPEKERQMRGLFLVPGVYLRVMADTVRQMGHNDRALYEGLEFGPDDLKANDSRVFVTDAAVMVKRAQQMAADQGLSFLLARELRVTIHGTLGLAALTSPTLEDALNSIQRYLQLRVPFVSVSQTDTGDNTVLHLKMVQDVTGHYSFLLETVTATLVMLAEQLIDRESAEQCGFTLQAGKLPGVKVRLSRDEPSYYRKFADQLPVAFEYGAEEDTMIFPKALLQAKMRLADAEASRMARDQCEFEMQKAIREQGDIVYAIRNMLQMTPGPLPSLEAMAERFCVSSRTLKRRLADKNTTYREIVESVLKDRAIQLLRYTNQSVSEIAYELGYADLSNFSRAFRKWTGKSASEFREGGPDPAPELGP